MPPSPFPLFPPVQKPSSLLGYHRILSPSAGVRVSPLCLGTMNFGDAWKDLLGECSKEQTFEMLDYFYERGGNFVDTANNYQRGESEKWIGEWMKERENRDQMVIATKFTTGFVPEGDDGGIKANLQGNHAKSLRISVEASLNKLQTTYIDLLYVHWWDFTTSVPELMNSLHHLVQAGKVLYLGISDTPAWLVVKCNEYARFHGLTTFSVYQGHWSCALRDFEREILPMCEAEGMGVAPWGVLGRGQLKPKEDFDDPDREGRKMGPQDTKYARLASKLAEIATNKSASITSIALAYVLHKAPYVFPVIGGRKIAHLEDNISALGIELTAEEMDEIDDSEAFDVGFPLSFLFAGKPYRHRYGSDDMPFVIANAALEAVPKRLAIRPGQGERKLELC